MGGGYQTHGAPYDRNVSKESSFIGKMNRSAIWTLSPNGLSQSALGVQIKEPLDLGWSFLAQLDAGFDPYSLRFANGPGSDFFNGGVPVNHQ